MFVDYHSQTTWLYFIYRRSEVFTHFVPFLLRLKHNLKSSIQTLRSDNAKEYMSQSVQSYMLQNGILNESSYVEH